MSDATPQCRYRWKMGETRCALPEGHDPLPNGARHANAQYVEAERLRAEVATLRARLAAAERERGPVCHVCKQGLRTEGGDFCSAPHAVSRNEYEVLHAELRAAEGERDSLLGKVDGRAKLYDADAWDGAMGALGKMRERAEAAEHALEEWTCRFSSPAHEVWADFVAATGGVAEATAEVRKIMADAGETLPESIRRLHAYLIRREAEREDALKRAESAERREREVTEALLAVSTDNAQDAIEDPIGHADREAAGFYRIGQGAMDAVRRALASATTLSGASGEESRAATTPPPRGSQEGGTSSASALFWREQHADARADLARVREALRGLVEAAHTYAWKSRPTTESGMDALNALDAALASARAALASQEET